MAIQISYDELKKNFLKYSTRLLSNYLVIDNTFAQIALTPIYEERLWAKFACYKLIPITRQVAHVFALKLANSSSLTH